MNTMYAHAYDFVANNDLQLPFLTASHNALAHYTLLETIMFSACV